MLIPGILLLIFSLSLLHFTRHKLEMSSRVLIGLAAGGYFGLFLAVNVMRPGISYLKGFLYLLGNGYLELLKLLVIPLILTSIIHAIINITHHDGRILRRLSIASCGLLLGLTSIASLIGIFVGKWFAVGSGLALPDFPVTPKNQPGTLIETLLSLIPNNPIAVMVNENTVGVVCLAVLIGLAARALQKKEPEISSHFRALVKTLFAVVKNLASLVLRLTPYGIFALLALLIMDQGFSLISGIFNFIAAMFVAMALVMLLHVMLLMINGVSPWYYFKNAYLPLFIAFMTRSSFATLPVTEETLQKKFKCQQITSTFVPSIGATIGMNACAGIFPAMLVVMVLTITNEPITLNIILSVMAINTIASLGISGIPGTAYIAATVTLTSLNLPYAVVALVQGVDPIIDMGRTAVNVNGVLTTAIITDRLLEKVSSEKSLAVVYPEKL